MIIAITATNMILSLDDMIYTIETIRRTGNIEGNTKVSPCLRRAHRYHPGYPQL